MTREEAIKKVRQMSLPKETMEILEALAPALRESEDERIRKGLVDFVTVMKSAIENGRSGLAIRKDDLRLCDSWLAYLEKQKEEEGYEAVPVESTLEYKLGFKAGKDSVNCLACDQYLKGYLAGRKVTEEEKQKEQKPAEKQDYSGLNDFERAIHRGFLCAGVENVPVTIINETAKDCLANLYDEQKPAEWSEEDEATLKSIIDAGSKGYHLDDYQLDFLRALRPSWKPSVEQMEALEYTIRDYREDNCNATANYLQEILDRLKNM